MEDITKITSVEKQNLYLCLTTASLIKDRMEAQRRQMREQEIKMQARLSK